MIRRDVAYVSDGRLTNAGYAELSAMERDIAALRATIAAMEAKLAAAASVADAAGGVTIDAEARAELVAIKGALA